MKKQLFQIFGLMLVMVVVVFVSTGYLRGGISPTLGFAAFLPKDNRQESTQAPTIRKAKTAFEQAKKDKVNFAESPCLSPDLGDGHALDVIHDPRIEADTQTQCTSYQDGTVAGLIEITPEGLIVNIVN